MNTLDYSSRANPTFLEKQLMVPFTTLTQNLAAKQRAYKLTPFENFIIQISLPSIPQICKTEKKKELFELGLSHLETRIQQYKLRKFYEHIVQVLSLYFKYYTEVIEILGENIEYWEMMNQGKSEQQIKLEKRVMYEKYYGSEDQNTQNVSMPEKRKKISKPAKSARSQILRQWILDTFSSRRIQLTE